MYFEKEALGEVDKWPFKLEHKKPSMVTSQLRFSKNLNPFNNRKIIVALYGKNLTSAWLKNGDDSHTV